MCNLYSETKGQAAIRTLFRSGHDKTGNLPAFPGIFPDQLAPVVRNSARDQLLRIRRHEAPQDPDMVRSERGPTVVRLRGIVDPLAWRARAEERTGRGRA
jgi:putative SOS response-associated peptidase YedK